SEGGPVAEFHTAGDVDRRLARAGHRELDAPPGLDAAEGVHAGGERKAGAVLEVQRAVRARGQAARDVASAHEDVLPAADDAGKITRAAAAHEGALRAADNGAATHLQHVGIHVEDAGTVPETDERAGHGRVVREIDATAELHARVSGARAQAGLRAR